VKELAMFKHILIPTDGSELAKIAIVNGIRFAKEINAKITAITVTQPYQYFAIEYVQVADTQEQYNTEMHAMAQRHLQVVKAAADAAGVPCELVHRSNLHPYEEIVRTAEDAGCDVIFQASHGRRGVGALLLGGETHRVLTHTKIPVLVFR
jgi:nucleotide-binding universal stress UspA family protein